MRIPVTVMVLLASQIAAADKFVAVTPVFGQFVGYSHPGNFQSVFESNSAGSYVQELVPQGETVEQWSQMITLTGTKDLALDREATPVDFAGKIASQFSKACPGTLSSKVVGSLKIDGFDSFVALMGCGTVQSGTPRSEVALIVAIKGRSDMYTLQWAERSAPITRAPVLNDDIWGPRFQQLNPIRVCDRMPEETTLPSSSCIGKPGGQ